MTSESLVDNKKSEYHSSSSSSVEYVLAAERARRRAAKDLEDRIGQVLVMAKMKMDEACWEFPGATSSREAASYVGQSIRQLRNLMDEISPAVLYELGLAPALEWLGQSLLASRGIRFSLSATGDLSDMDDDTRILLFRSVEEVFSWAGSNGKTREVKVSLHREAAWACLVIEEDGASFWRPETLEAAWAGGLHRLREWVSYLGGELDVVLQGDQGTRLAIGVPWTRA